MFDKAKINIPCPGCGKKIAKSIDRLKLQPDITCPGCGRAIHVNLDDLERTIDRAKKAVSDFRRKLSRIGKRR